LPVIDEIAKDYAGEVVFLGVAGRAGFDETADRAAELFSDRIMWGLDDDIWDLYGVPYQPVTFLITGDDIVMQTWPGPADEATIRERLDDLVATG